MPPSTATPKATPAEPITPATSPEYAHRASTHREAQDTKNRLTAKRKLEALLKDAENDEIRHDESKPCYIFYPESTTVKIRDILSMLALVLTFAVVPFEVAFVDALPKPDPTDALWIFNRAVDLLFLYDMLLQFFVARPQRSPIVDEFAADGLDDGMEEALQEMVGNGFEFRLRYIFLGYLRGWLILDALALGPSVFEIYSAISAGQGSLDGFGETNSSSLLANGSTSLLDAGAAAVSGYASSQDGLNAARVAKTAKAIKFLRATRMFKLVRLLKLTKLLRAFKMLNDPHGPFIRLIDYVTLAFIAHQRKFAIAKLLLIFFLLAHVQACVLGLTSIFADQRANTWWGTMGYCFPSSVTDAEAGLEPSIACVSPLYQYFVCCTWAFEFYLNLPTFYTQVGPGEPVFLDGDSSSLFRTHEYILFVLCGIVGGLMGLYIQGRVVEVLTSPPNTAESVNKFCKTFDVKREIRQNLQVYFERLAKMSGTKPAGQFHLLSPSLAQQVMLDVHGKWLAKLPFHRFITRELNPDYPRAMHMRRPIDLRRHGATTLSKIALSMSPTLLIPRERASAGRMYVIQKGVALDQGKALLLTTGDNWGAVEAICGPLPPALQSSGPSWRIERVEALTFLQLFFLDHQKLSAIVKEAPELRDAYVKMRAWGFHRRLLMGVGMAATMEKLRRTAKEMAASGGAGRGSGGDASSTGADESSSPAATASAAAQVDGGGGAGDARRGGGGGSSSSSSSSSSSLSASEAQQQLLERLSALQHQQASMLKEQEAMRQEVRNSLREARRVAASGAGSDAAMTA